jgi:hypothetical protein
MPADFDDTAELCSKRNAGCAIILLVEIPVKVAHAEIPACRHVVLQVGYIASR